MNLNRSASLTIVILTIVMVSHNPDLARTASSSLSPYVAGVERILRKSGLKHELTAMGSIIEGNLDEILPVLREMHEQPSAEPRHIAMGEVARGGQYISRRRREIWEEPREPKSAIATW